MSKTNGKEAYRDKARAILGLWGAEITDLRARSRGMKTEARLQAKQVEELERLYTEAFRQYSRIQDSNGENLDDVKQAFEIACERIRQKLDTLIEVVV